MNDVIFRAELKDLDKYVYGAYLFHPKDEMHIIIEPQKDNDGNILRGFTFHHVKGETVGMELAVWQNEGFKRRKFYVGDIIDEGDNFPSVIRFGENDVNGYGFYLEEVGTEQGCEQPIRHVINAFTTFPDKTKVISQVWKYKVDVYIAETPDGEFICRNEYERGLLIKNHARLYPDLKEVIFREEKMTISELDNSLATDMSVEYYSSDVLQEVLSE